MLVQLLINHPKLLMTFHDSTLTDPSLRERHWSWCNFYSGSLDLRQGPMLQEIISLPKS